MESVTRKEEGVRKIRRVQAELLSHGYQYRQGKGSHQIWTHPLLPSSRLVLCGSGGEDALKYQETRLKKQLHQLKERAS